MRKHTKIVLKIITWLTNVVWLQVMLAFVYAPILVAWGLPLSIASIFGNIAFPIFLISFLGLSAALFITQILNFNCTHAAWALDTLSSWWIWLLEFSSPRWLVGFIDPGILILVLIVFVGIFCAWLTRRWHAAIRLAISGALLITILTILKTAQQGPPQLEFTYRAKKHLIVRNGHELIMILQSMHAPITSIDSWITFTLTPTMYKKYGTATIDELILINPSPSIEKAFSHQISLKINRTTRVKDQIYMRTLDQSKQKVIIDAHAHPCSIAIIPSKSKQ